MHTSSYRSHTHDILCSAVRILSNSATSLYHTLSAKVLRRNLLEPQNDQQNLYFDRETVKRRRHEEYLELKKKEEADPALAEAFKRRRMEEKARKAEAKKAREREEEEEREKGKKTDEEEQDESLMELELEGIRAARKGSVHRHHDYTNRRDDDDSDDDDDDDDDDTIPVYRGLKDRVPSMLAIVSGGADGNLVVYNVDSRREVNTFKLMGFPGFYNPVVSVSEHHACLIVCTVMA